MFNLFNPQSEIRNPQSVKNRPGSRAKLSGLTDEWVEAFFRRLERQAYWLREIAHKFDFQRDPKDAPYINLAAAVGADFIISRDHDLLDLMSSTMTTARNFARGSARSK